MKKLNPIILITILSLACSSLSAGPFGLEQGQTIEEIAPAAEEVKPGIYVTTIVPKPHSAFEKYVLRISPKGGLYWVKGIGKDISTNRYGHSLKSDFDSLKEKLEKNYGKGELVDFLLTGSIWDEPEDYMTALAKDERVLMCSWENKSGTPIMDDIASLGLIASALSNESGYLSVEYSFTNKEQCEAEIAALEDDAL